MARLNKATIIGHYGQDPDLKHTESGIPVISFTVATNEGYYDKNSEWVDKTEWHRIVGFGERAEKWVTKIHKGTFLYLEGRLQTRSWEGEDGVKRYTTEIIASRIEILDKKPSDAPPPPDDDNLPF